MFIDHSNHSEGLTLFYMRLGHYGSYKPNWSTISTNFRLYRVLKGNLQVVKFQDFEHKRARMAYFFGKQVEKFMSVHSKQKKVKGQILYKIPKKVKVV